MQLVLFHGTSARAAKKRSGVRDTSRAAYEGLVDTGKLGDQERTIMLALHRNARRDWSLQEIVRLTGIAINAVAGRVNGLKKKGFLVECDKRACSITGKTVRPVRIS